MADKEYPISLQTSWLLGGICDKLSTYTYSLNPIVSKGFVKGGICHGKTAITRVFKFLKITKDQELVAVIADSRNKVLAVFPFDTCVAFERKYKQRITFCTPNSMFLVKIANLKYVSPLQLRRDYGATPRATVDTVVLEIIDFDAFQRDQIPMISLIDKELTFVYDEQMYIKCFKKEEDIYKKLHQQVQDDYDDVVSS